MKKLALVLAAVVLVLAVPAAAQDNGSGSCSTQTVRGNYSVTCTGFVSPAANAPQVPFTAMAALACTWGGSCTAAGMVSLGGAILQQSVSGVAVVNPDCTGTITYDQKLNGQPGPKLNIIFHILDGGNQMLGMSVDPGTNMLCTLRLISR